MDGYALSTGREKGGTIYEKLRRWERFSLDVMSIPRRVNDIPVVGLYSLPIINQSINQSLFCTVTGSE